MNLNKPRAFAFLSVILAGMILAGSAAAPAQAAPKGTKKQVKTDVRGKTINQLDKKGRIVSAVRLDKFGPELGRETTTVYTRDKQGKPLSRTLTNKLMSRQETYNKKGRVVKAVQDDNFGVEWGRHREFDDYKYNKQGFLISNRETSKMENAVHKYDKKKRVIESKIERKVGLGAQRKSVITYAYDNKTGRPVQRVEKNDYGIIRTTAFDPILWLPVKQQAKYNFGLGSTRETRIEYTWDKKTGLPLQRVDSNKYGVTQTFYDTEEKGKHGIPVGSMAKINFGLKAARETRTVIKSDPRNGLTQATKAENKYETKWIVYDAYNDGLFGVPEKIENKRKFGLGVDRHTITQVKANTWNGLFTHTKELKSPDRKPKKKKPPKKTK